MKKKVLLKKKKKPKQDTAKNEEAWWEETPPPKKSFLEVLREKWRSVQAKYTFSTAPRPSFLMFKRFLAICLGFTDIYLCLATFNRTPVITVLLAPTVWILFDYVKQTERKSS